MTAPAHPLDPLRIPLEVALKPGMVGRVKGLHQAVQGAAAKLKADLPQPLQAPLDAVVGALEGFDNLDAPARLAAVERAHGLFTALRQAWTPGAQPPPPPAEPAPEKPKPRRRAAPVEPAPPPPPPQRDPLAAPVGVLSGVGPKLAEALTAKGIDTLADLLRTTPRAYEDRTTIRPIASLEIGERALVRGEVLHANPGGFGRQRRFEVVISDGTGSLRLTYFAFNAQHMSRKFRPGLKVTAAGAITRFGAQKQMVHPEVQTAEDDVDATAGVVPVYPELEGIPKFRLRKLIAQALEALKDRIPEVLPAHVREALALPTSHDALCYLHLPPADADVEKLSFRDTAAHKRLAFEEFFIMQVALGQRKLGQAKARATVVPCEQAAGPLMLGFLPFNPTGAQKRVVGEILRDMARPEPMARLLQGDVGSGKTAVAAAACLVAQRAGLQAAIVAPTEILAEQHYRNFARMLGKAGVVLDLVTGSLTPKQRVSALGRLAQGVTQVAVGTHSLLQEGVAFKNLAVAVVDEQHRFGVEQRVALRQKGPTVAGVPCVPHLLVMTATPIPRTLALTLYGDLDLSVLDEMPPGRKPVVTKLVTERSRDKHLAAIHRALLEGRQVFVVYPLVEESENSDLKDATQGAEEFRALFPETTVELLHGRMSGQDKDRVMTRFLRKEAGILVSTTVIEVGVDVPNATVMWIEHAERFGLSQLHQLRGRVGRGTDNSECYLVARGGGEDAERRLDIMVQTQDGFRVAEEDLSIRGPGDFFGTRQAGAPPFMFANLLRHGAMLEEARRHALALLQKDPNLQAPEQQALRHALEERYHYRIELVGSG